MRALPIFLASLITLAAPASAAPGERITVTGEIIVSDAHIPC